MFAHQRFGRLGWSLVAAMGLCLAGCTSLDEYVHNGFKVGPNYCAPAGPVAAHWIDAYDSHLRGDTQDLSCWWTVFRDPTLNQLIAHAYRQNISLKEAGFRILEARAQRGIAVGGLFPQTQTANGSVQRVALPADQVGPGFPRYYNLYNAGFNLAWQLDLWGQFRRAVEAADAQLDYSVAGYDQVLITLLAAVAGDYVEIRSDQQQIAVLKANAELQRGILVIVDKRFKAGRVNELDVDQAVSNLKQIEAQIPPLEADMRQANDRLCVLLGIPPDDLVKCLGTAAIPTVPPTVAIGIPAQLLTRRPDIRQAERTAAAQSAQIGIAVSQAYPMVTITGTVGWQSQQLSQLFTPAGFNGTVGPTFQWNILNYGRLLNNDRLQEARFRELVAAYQQTVLQAQSEVENGLAAFLQSQIQTKILEESVTASQKAVNIVAKQYQAGTVDFNRVATIELALVQQQQLLALAQAGIAQGLIQTYLALGGGWEIRCTPQENSGPLGPIVPPPESPSKPIMPPSLAPLTQPAGSVPEVLPTPVPKKEGSPVDSGK
jgi:NodT family efflux transporter outer membrane factor (OMF) lipoprotein